MFLCSLLLALGSLCGCATPWQRAGSSQPVIGARRSPNSKSTAVGTNCSVRAESPPSEEVAALSAAPLDGDPFWAALHSVPGSSPVRDDFGLAKPFPAGTDTASFSPEVIALEKELADFASIALPEPPEASPFSADQKTEAECPLLQRIASDHGHYYSLDTAMVVAVGTAVAATFAHTYVDEEVYRQVHHAVWHGDGDEWSVPLHATKILGEGTITLPLFGAAWLAGEVFDELPFFDVAGTWGERSLRAFLVGGPPLLAMQYATGGSRPLEADWGSDWRPFQDTNGASGHAFMGALPLLTAAEMIDWWPGRIALVIVSLFPGLSRVADDDHYASQVLLGWTMAYVAVTAVDRTDNPDNHVSIFPLIAGDRVGAAIEYRW